MQTETSKLTNKEIEGFKQNGYLIKRGVLDPMLMAQARDSLWEAAPPTLKRDDPKTWVGAFADERWTWKYRDRGHEEWMVKLLATDPSVWGMAEQLLGSGNLEVPEHIRGIYCIFPEGDVPKRPMYCHVDRHPFHLGVVGYIDDVPPGGGGFTVWPGSHHTFFYDFETQYTYNAKEEQHIQHLKEICGNPETSHSVDCHGSAGDIVFWHHRIGHSAGHNRSGQIRQAVLYDFRRQDLLETQDEPPPSDMWRDWDGV